jgi:hypothetical protein
VLLTPVYQIRIMEGRSSRRSAPIRGALVRRVRVSVAVRIFCSLFPNFFERQGAAASSPATVYISCHSDHSGENVMRQAQPPSDPERFASEVLRPVAPVGLPDSSGAIPSELPSGGAHRRGFHAYAAQVDYRSSAIDSNLLRRLPSWVTLLTRPVLANTYGLYP